MAVGPRNSRIIANCGAQAFFARRVFNADCKNPRYLYHRPYSILYLCTIAFHTVLFILTSVASLTFYSRQLRLSPYRLSAGRPLLSPSQAPRRLARTVSLRDPFLCPVIFTSWGTLFRHRTTLPPLDKVNTLPMAVCRYFLGISPCKSTM